MNLRKEDVSIKGKRTTLDSTSIGGKTIIVQGNILTLASVKDAVCDYGIDNPEIIVEGLRKSSEALCG